MESFSVSLVKEFTALFFAALPLSLGSAATYSSTALPITPNVEALIIRGDNYEPGRLVNVFDSEGTKRFTIERSRSGSKQWYVYAEPQHVQVSAITIGQFGRKVVNEDGSTTDLKFGSGILGKLHRHFYDSAGNLFSWNRRSQFLERIVNPGGLSEEHRHKVAYIHQLRNRRFDYELLVDTSQIDLVKALATAFVALKTQWSTLSRNSTPAQRQGRVSKDGNAKGKFVHDLAENLRVYEPRPVSNAPRDFFNPPEFMIQQLHG